MEDKYTYLFLDIVTIIGPLMLSFDKKVAFYKSWKTFIYSMLPVSLFYILWDIYFTKTGVWEFNKPFLIDKFLFNLPIEEYIFFIVVPYACLFIHACLIAYFPQYSKKGKIWFIPLFALSIGMTIFFYQQIYTALTFGLLSITIGYLMLFEKQLLEKIGTHLFFSWVIALIPMSYVNGILTSKPVLIYNNSENCGFRIGTIPFEDFFYNLLFMALMIVLFEKIQSKQTKESH